MSQEHIRISDTDASIGASRLQVSNPRPDLPPRFVDLNQQITAVWTDLLTEIARLQGRVEALESRTWTSMLRDQLRRWWRRVRT